MMVFKSISKSELFFLVCSVLIFILMVFSEFSWGIFFFKSMSTSSSFSEMISLDEISMPFLLFSVLVVCSVFLFSFYYMSEEENKTFLLFILLFILLMWILILGKTLSLMFIGWEGVGIISFILIGWFSSRDLACFSAKKAVLMNRFTDFFFFILVGMEILSGSNLFMKKKDMLLFKETENFQGVSLFFMSFLLTMSVIGKSAQFITHPWLTSAMEGPTPVSSLLHSSTMVVAGVYLFIRLIPFMNEGDADSMSLITGLVVLTMIAISISGLVHKDFKKVVAISTTSQLSFMMTLCCMGEKELAFLHMVLHSFFKASLFIFSGVIIHNEGSDQDSRKAKLSSGQYFQKSIFLFSTMGLLGSPFLGAFFSKHCFVNFSLGSWSGLMGLNFTIMIFSLVSLLMTTIYSIRLLINSNLMNDREIMKKIMSVSEENGMLKICQFILITGTAFFGFFFFSLTNMSLNQSYKFSFLSEYMSFCSNWVFLFLIFSGTFICFNSKKNSWTSFHYFFSSEMVLLLFNLLEKFSKNQVYSLEKNFFLSAIKKNFKSILIKPKFSDFGESMKAVGSKSFTFILFLIIYFFFNAVLIF